MVGEPLCDVGTLSWSLITLLRIVYWNYWLVADVTPVVSPDRAEHDILGMILYVFCPIWATFVGGEPLFDVGFPSWALITFLRIIYWKQSGCLSTWHLSGPPTELNVIFLDDFVFFANSVYFCGRKTTLWCRNPLLSTNKFTWGHLMKIEWLITNVTAVGSPDRAERAISGMILGIFCLIQATFVVGEPLCDVRAPSWALITLFRTI